MTVLFSILSVFSTFFFNDYIFLYNLQNNIVLTSCWLPFSNRRESTKQGSEENASLHLIAYPVYSECGCLLKQSRHRAPGSDQGPTRPC